MFLKKNEKKPLFRWGREIMEVNGIQVAHYMPGRVRLKALPIKGNPPLAQKITERFMIIKGIKQVKANALTGSLLIEYEAAELQSPDAAAIVGRGSEVFATPAGP